MMLRGVRVVSNRQTAHWAHPPSLVQQWLGQSGGRKQLASILPAPTPFDDLLTGPHLAR